MNPDLLLVGGAILALLLIASLVGGILALRARGRSEGHRHTIGNLNARIAAWWLMVGIIFAAVWVGHIALCLLFAFLAFLGLREMLSLTATRLGDHRSLFVAFFLALPLQFLFVYLYWYGMFAIFIPVYVFSYLAIRSALAGDCEHYLARTAKIQWALFMTVYSFSHLPALMMLDITTPGWHGQNSNLLLWLLLVVQLSDVFQYVWGKLLGKRPIVPKLSPNKTWAGFLGGIASASGCGAALWWITPFNPLQAAAIALLLCLLGFCGGLVLSAVKRDAGIKDFGSVLAGHGGILDRMDSLTFAGPVFFHVVRYFFVL
jgi:phosphatidate cytidylyltransferase